MVKLLKSKFVTLALPWALLLTVLLSFPHSVWAAGTKGMPALGSSLLPVQVFLADAPVEEATAAEEEAAPTAKELEKAEAKKAKAAEKAAKKAAKAEAKAAKEAAKAAEKAAAEPETAPTETAPAEATPADT